MTLAREYPRGLELAVKVSQFGAGRQRPVKKQVGGLFESRLFGKVVNRVTAVLEHALPAVDKRGLGAVEIDALQTAMKFYVVRGH